jgi:hypothetical protein
MKKRSTATGLILLSAGLLLGIITTSQAIASNNSEASVPMMGSGISDRVILLGTKLAQEIK